VQVESVLHLRLQEVLFSSAEVAAVAEVVGAETVQQAVVLAVTAAAVQVHHLMAAH
jgi:hypothetical protein